MWFCLADSCEDSTARGAPYVGIPTTHSPKYHQDYDICMASFFLKISWGRKKKLGDPIREVIWIDFTVPDKTNA